MFKQQRRYVTELDLAKIFYIPDIKNCALEIKGNRITRFRIKIGYLRQIWNKRL